jgi:hypothetical protein
MRRAGCRGDEASVSALMAMLERFAYYLESRRLEFPPAAVLETVTSLVHRGFFGAEVAA